MKNKKDLLKAKFKNYKNLAELKPSPNKIPKEFPQCFINFQLIETVKEVISLNNKRNVLIAGKKESGLTQLVEWCSI